MPKCRQKKNLGGEFARDVLAVLIALNLEDCLPFLPADLKLELRKVLESGEGHGRKRKKFSRFKS